MKRRLLPLLLLLIAGDASADKLCVPTAYGVPGKDGAPVWTTFDTSTSAGSIDASIDDPRWRGSSGHAIRTGSMDPPLDFRSVYTTSGGAQYVELSWKASVGVVGSGHAMYVGFMTPGDVGSAKVIRFRIPSVGAAAPATEGTFFQCNGTDGDCAGECQDGSTSPTCAHKTAWYSIYNFSELCDHDSATPAPNCDCTFGFTGFTNADRFVAAPNTPEWLAVHDSSVAFTTNLRPSAYYSSDPSGRWTFRLRVPIDTTTGGVLDLNKGILPGTQMWYEAPVDVTGTGSTPHLQWPRLDSHGACFPDNDFQRFEMPSPLTFGDVVLIDPSYNPGFSPVSSLPAGCGGVSVVSSDLHVIGPGGTPGNTIWGDVSGARFDNQFVATVHNDSLNQVDANTLQARFRLADWGVQITPWGDEPDFSTGIWDDVPATTGTNPAVNTTTPIGAGGSQTFTFNWKLTDPQMAKYGLSTTGGQTNSHHQCLLVELSGTSGGTSGGGTIAFSNRSAYTNMEFGSMSTFEQFAKIAAGSGYAGRDVYLVLMGKNTPEKIQTTGRDYVNMNMFNKEWQLKGLYGGYAYGGFTYAGEQVQNQDVLELAWNSPLLPGWMELAYLERVRQSRAVENNKVTMEALVTDMRQNLSVPTISDILPAFEVYAYVDTGETYSSGKKTHHVLAPLTSFGYDLWHDGSMSGFSQVIDNAEKVGPNVYRVRTDKDGNAIVRVRSTSDDGTLTPVDHVCGGGCCSPRCPNYVGLNNTVPGLLVGCVVFRRRKKKQR